MALTIYHYPKCKKSRAALEYIKSMGVNHVVINYTESGINKEEIKNLKDLLGLSPIELIRTQEEFFKENIKDRELSDDEYIEILVQYPKLLKRPIVVNEGKSLIADPAELINSIL